MISTFLGFDIDAWRDMYMLYIFDKGESPIDLYEIRKYWFSKQPLTPDASLKLGFQLSRAYDENIDTEPVIDMIEKFIARRA